jgi:hypothetical protein
MRTLVYAAGAYALGMGVAEAFAPGPGATGGDMCTGKGCLPKTRSMGKLQTMKMLVDPHSVEDPADVVARANSMIGKTSIHSAAATFEASFAAPSATNPADATAQAAAAPAPARAWTPPIGYTPARTQSQRSSNAAPTDGPDAVMARVSEMLAAKASTAKPDVTTAVAPAQSVPAAKKWVPYGGYDPKARRPVASAVASVAVPAAPAAAGPAAPPAKRWEPYGGYDPKARGSPPLVQASPVVDASRQFQQQVQTDTLSRYDARSHAETS